MNSRLNIQEIVVNDSLEILLALNNGGKRFTDLHHLFKSPATLTFRLRLLEEHGLIDRKLIASSRSTVHYVLTEHGKKLAEIYKKYREDVNESILLLDPP